MESHPSCAATLRSIVPLTADTNVYTYEPDREMPFVPGQFFNLALPDTAPRRERSYSAWSDAAEPARLAFCVKLFPGGAASEMFRRAAVGDVHTFRGPFGVFTLRPDPDAIVWVATATGIAPFRSMLFQMRREAEPRSVRLYFGVRSEPDVFLREELDDAQAALPDFRWTLCLSRGAPHADAFPGRVTAAVERDFPAPDARFYLCGNNAMIAEVRALLKERGLDRRRVHSEKYY